MIKSKLQQLRIRRNISQEDIARLLFVTQSTYSRKERGKTEITMSEWQCLATILSVELDDIYQDNSNLNSTEKRPVQISPVTESLENISVYKKQNLKLKDKIKMLKAELKKARKKQGH